MTVKHGLEEGDYHLCRACRRPITDEDMAHDHYAEGVSCPYCYDEKSETQRARYAERQRQRELEKERASQAK